MLRNVLKVVRYGLCGSILAIAAVQGFMPEVDLNAIIPGTLGFAVAGLSSAKALAVLWMPLFEVQGYVINMDRLTVIVAGLAIIIAFMSCACRKKPFRRATCGSALLNGATIVPFGVIAFAPFHETLKQAALSSTGSLTLAGLVGIFYVGSDIFLPPSEWD